MSDFRYHDPHLRTERQVAPAFTERIEGSPHDRSTPWSGQLEGLCALTQEMIAELPPFERSDAVFQRTLNAAGCEMQRMLDRLALLRERMFPQNATDVDGKLLSIWEATVGLPVAPPGVSEIDRRNLLLAHLRAHDASSGLAWFDAMSKVMGNIWSYEEGPPDYTITLYIPFEPGVPASVRAESFAREVTASHLDIAVQYNTGFIIGEGLVGEDRL